MTDLQDAKLRAELPSFVRAGHETIRFADGDRGDYETDDTTVTVLSDAHGILSRIAGTESYKGGLHRPILDIDFGAALVPSSTKGHFHLYLDKPMPWQDYADLVTVLGRVGILEDGYVKACLDRGYSSVRLPWINKLNLNRKVMPF